MKYGKPLIIILLIFTFCSCKLEELKPITPQIIPVPLEETIIKGKFVLNQNTSIHYDDAFKSVASYFSNFLSNAFQIDSWTKKASVKNHINFKLDVTILNPEAYKLSVKEDKITISASNKKGAFYAVQTLRQLLPTTFENRTFKEKQVAIQCLEIKDEPQFAYRGMHLDVGRHLFSVEFIKKYINNLAMLKMNTFHWHLTEDQGWRIEIKNYPKLQEIGAFRDETLFGHYSDQPHTFNGKRYGGFYTQDQIKDIVAYAQERQITIIPEIEMPGHSQAAIAAYPELGCTGNQVEVATKWGVFNDIYCTKDETFTFLENVLDEVIALFPSKYIHIGGDEAPKTHWKNCKDCQNRIKTEGLKDEHELQNYFITRIEKYLNSKGRQIIGWDEILEGGLAPNATVMSWRGTQGAIEAAKKSHKVILTPSSHCYFDHYQSTNEDEPLAIGGFLPLKKVYSFNPIPKELTKDEAKYVLGAQGNVWTEYMPNSMQVDYMVFPRILAMSEVVWSANKNKNYDDFVKRVENFNTRLKVLDINYANHLYEIEGKLLQKVNTLSYQLKNMSNTHQIVYSLDGKDPIFNLYPEYNKPIVIDSSVTIKAATFNKEGKQISKIFSEKLNFHKAVGKQIALNVKPNKAYQGSGKEGFINGISGSSKRHGDKEWLGFWGDDVEITIDLGEKTKVNSIATRFYNGQGQWIYAPKKIKIVMDNEENKIFSISNTNDLLVNFNASFKTKTQIIKLKIINFGIIPEGKQGAGHKAWLFIDEIIVN